MKEKQETKKEEVVRKSVEEVKSVKESEIEGGIRALRLLLLIN